MLKNLHYIFLLALFFSACSSPDELNSPLDKKQIDDPNLGDPKIIFEPNPLIISNLHPQKSESYEFEIINVSNNLYVIENLILNNGENFAFDLESEITLNSRLNDGDRITLSMICNPKAPGIHKDTLVADSRLNQRLFVELISPYIYGEDVLFSSTSVGEISGALVRIHNLSDGAITIDEITFQENPNNAFSFFGSLDLPIAINSNSFEIIEVSFEPTTQGDYSGVIKFVTSFTGVKDETIQLNATAN